MQPGGFQTIALNSGLPNTTMRAIIDGTTRRAAPASR
jgi:hypothetical protein